MQETRVRSLGWEVPVEKGMAIHSSTLAWRIPRTEKLGGPQSTGSQRVRHNRVTDTFILTFHAETPSPSCHLRQGCQPVTKELQA